MSTDACKLFDSDNKLKVKMERSLDANVSVLNTLFDKCGDVVQKTFVIERTQGDAKIHIIYIDGLTDNGMVEETIIKPVTFEWRYEDGKNLWESILYREAQTVDIKEETSFDLVIGSVLKGDTAIFVDGYAKAMVMSTKKLPLRSIGTNDNESGMRGPRDSFNEGFRQSTALIRRRIKDSKLKVEQSFMGQRSRTDYALMYLSDIAKPELVENIKKRFEMYDIDAVFDSGMAEHLLEESWYSPFPVFQSTTRPDKVASAITEGRVAIVFDNSPEVLIAPGNFNMFMQASDDYYNRWAVGTFARFLRYIAAFLAVTLPGFYVAVTVYQSEVIPTTLLYAIASARTLVTFPIVIEVIIMEFLFELLREAGIRLPGPLGNTIGVVGGLIVGQSAVDAGIVSTMVVIVVALTAIASFAIPNEAFSSVFRLLKFFILITSACFGLYGFILGLIIVAIHLSGLTSFGVPYMAPVVGGGINGMQANQDFLVRSPIKAMKNRPLWVRKMSQVRLKKKDSNK